MNRSLAILLVEDDPILGELTAEALAACGYDALLATSCIDAFRVLSSPHRFEVVLLDLDLGDERGETLILKLRAVAAAIPAVIILSAQPRIELDHAAALVGAKAVLQKPCSATKIAETVDRVAA